MAPYLILAVAAAVLGFFLCELHPSRRNDLIFLVVMSVAMFFLSILRATAVGIDYQMYLNFYWEVCEGGLPFIFSQNNVYWREIGYSLLEYLLSLIGPSPVVFSSGIALLCLGLNAVFLYKYSPSVWLSMFIFISFGFFGYTLCTIRHQIAIAIFMFALPYLQKRQFVPYLLIILLTATFHKSMLIWIPVYFLAQLAMDWRTYTFYGVCLGLYFLFSERVLSVITQYIYTEYQVGSYYMQGRDPATVFIPLVFFAVVLLMQKPLLARNPQNLPLMNLSMYCACLFLMTLKHFVFQRFALVLLPVSMLLLPEITRCLAISPQQQAELDGLRKAVKTGSGNKKANQQRYGELRGELRDKRAMYYASIGFILFGGFLYFGWILSMNRLNLVPYIWDFSMLGL